MITVRVLSFLPDVPYKHERIREKERLIMRIAYYVGFVAAAAISLQLLVYQLRQSSTDIRDSSHLRIRSTTIDSSIVVVTSKSAPTKAKIKANVTVSQVERRFRERKRSVESACKQFQSDRRLRRQFPSNPRYTYSTLYVDDKHKLIYCAVLKAGCSSWKSLVLVLTGKYPNLESIKPEDIHVYGQYKYLLNTTSAPKVLNSTSVLEEIREKLRTYTKVMVHRDPLDRFMSAYTNKFVRGDPGFLLTIGRKILRKRGGLSKKQIMTGRGVRFDEFASYVAKYAANSSIANRHWRPASVMCEPCLIHYDFYASTSTLDEDTNFILNAIGAPKGLRVPHKNPSSDRPDLSESLRSVSAKVRGQLYDLYKLDYFLFNYSMPAL